MTKPFLGKIAHFYTVNLLKYTGITGVSPASYEIFKQLFKQIVYR